MVWGHICAKLHLPFSALIFPRALKACSKIFESSLSRFDKMLVINPAFTQGTLVSSKNKNWNTTFYQVHSSQYSHLHGHLVVIENLKSDIDWPSFLLWKPWTLFTTKIKNRFSLVTPNIPLPTSSESLVFYQIHTPWFNDYFLPLITRVVQELNYPRTYSRTQSNDPTVKLRQHINQLLFLFIWTWLIPWSLS